MNTLNEYICARCARIGDTCCRLAQDFQGECFPVSAAELARIKQALPAVQDAVSVEILPESARSVTAMNPLAAITPAAPNTLAFMKAMQSLFPFEKEAVKKAFDPAGRHIRLALPDGRTCVFLSASGCLLPSWSKPWFCRIFPFWVVDGKIRHFNSATCLALKETSSIRELLNRFGITADDVLNLFKQMRKDWGITS